MASHARLGKSYQKHYNEEWERDPEFKNWIQKSSETLIRKGKGEAFCKVCHTPLRAHRTDLLGHKRTQKHQKLEKVLCANQPSIRQVFETSSADKNLSKINDLKLASYVACHSSIRSIDHLGELLRGIGEGSKLADLHLHRTKRSQLILKILGPAMLQDIVDDVDDSFYSIIVDESTDISTKKYLAVMIRYLSFRKKMMIVDFLGLIQLTRATADVLYEALKAFLTNIGLPLRRMIGLGTDGAQSICGNNHSLYTLMRNDAPNLILIRCICHSLNNCASEASKELPSSLEYMLRETIGWFSHSAIRKDKYAEIYKNLHNGLEPPLLIKLAETRWLVWGQGVARTLEQYEELKALFVQASAPGNAERCYSAQTLGNMYTDNSNKLYLTFLRPVLKEVNRVNMIFQSTVADVTKVYREVRVLVFSLARRILKNDSVPEASSEDGVLRSCELAALRGALKDGNAYRPLDFIDFGESFRMATTSLEMQLSVLEGVKQRCANFLVKLTKELVDRLPACIETVERMRFFAPQRVLTRRARPLFRQLPLDLAPGVFERETLENQWAALGELTIGDVCPDVGGEMDASEIDVIQFWANVWSLKNGVAAQPYRELAEYVICLLSLPLSNAVVERLFSLLGVVKTKQRNALSLKMLEAILRVREHMRAMNVCCKSFQPSAQMLAAFTADVLYRRRAPKRIFPGEDPEEMPDSPDEETPDPDDHHVLYTMELMGGLDVAEIVL